MAMSQSLRSGSDEVTEQAFDICCYCANNDTINQATHFCFDCGVFGRYLCATCLRNHNLFVSGNHDINHIGSQLIKRVITPEQSAGSPTQKLKREHGQKLPTDTSVVSGSEMSEIKMLAEKRKKKLDEKEQECEALSAKIEEKDDQLLKLEGNIRELKTQNKSAVAEKKDRQKMVMQLEQQLEKSISENTELQSQNEALLNQNKNIAAEKSKVEAELKAVIKDKDQQIKNVHTTLEKAYKDFKRKQDEVKEACDREIRTVNNQLSYVMKERDDLKIRIEEKDEQLLKLEGNIRELKTQNKNAVAEKTDRQNMVMELEQQVEKSFSENTELQSQNEALLNQNKNIAAEKSKVEAELKAIIKDKDQQIKNVHTTLEKAYKDFKRKQDEVKEACDRDKRTVNNQLSYVMKKRHDLKIRIEEKDEQLLKLEGNIRQLKTQNKSAVAEKKDRQKMVMELEQQDEKSISENTELQSQNEALLNQNKNIAAEKSKVEAELKAVIKDKDQQIKNVHTTLEKAYKDFKRKQDEVKEACDRDKRTVNNQLSYVMKERDDLKIRFSKLAGAKLTDENADIADLSDPNRAMKVSERFGSLHDDEWTDAFEELKKKKVTVKDSIQFLLRVLQDCLEFCNELKETQMHSLNNVLMHPSQDVTKFANEPRKNVGGFKEKPRISSKDEKVVREVRRQIGVSGTCIEEVKQVFLMETKSWDKQGYEKKQLEMCLPYLQKCAEICWLMVLHDPPLYMKMDAKNGDKMDANLYTVYSQSGDKIDYLVWPPLFNEIGGGLITKGAAEGLKTIKKK